MWYVYLVACSDNSLYCGVTTDLNRRINEHNHAQKGAKYTRSRRPVKLVWSTTAKNRSEAQKEEAKIKKLSRKQKLQLIHG
tara:strand:+ start:332 stop:574 length:243 start_codon:yes stop_codon:yes gene_type:complete